VQYILEGAAKAGKSVSDFLNSTQFQVSAPAGVALFAATLYMTSNATMRNPQLVLKNSVYCGVATAQMVAQATAPGLPELGTKLGRVNAVVGNFPDFLKSFRLTLDQVKQTAQSLGAPQSDIDAIGPDNPNWSSIINADSNTITGGQSQSNDFTTKFYTAYALNSDGIRDFLESLYGR